MKNDESGSWNTLEVAKLVTSVLTPLLIVWLAYVVDDTVRDAELIRQRAEDERIQAETRQTAVREFSTFIYERRSRSALLLSALLRHAQDPVAESRQEVVERKRQYDEAYFRWNSHHQANLLLVRQILGSSEYSDLEAFVEFRLVRAVFWPIDRCLTDAYDATIRGRDPTAILAKCEASKLIQRALDCGHAITGELFGLSNNKRTSGGASTQTLSARCR